jgi:hypothetical protein
MCREVMSLSLSTHNGATPDFVMVRILGGTASVEKLLHKNKFDVWQYIFSQTCRSEGYIGHLTGTEKRPLAVTPATTENTAAMEARDAKDDKLQTAIMVSIHSDMLMHTRDKATAAQQWSALFAAFAPKSKTRKFNLNHQLNTNSYPEKYESDTMQNYISHMASLRRKLGETGLIT